MRGLCIPASTIFIVILYTARTRTMTTDDSTRILNWAPLRLKSPYLTFMNKFYNPSWRTRHPITKEEEALRYLQLPRGVPFSTVCGACFARSHISANLTVSVTGHEYRSVPKTYNNNRKTKYHVGYLECLMTYMITAPIEKDGTITCTLNRGKQTIIETISFAVVDASVDEAPKELEIQDPQKEISLSCPLPHEMPSSRNPLVHVWHEDSEVFPSVSSLTPEMRPTMSIRRSKNTRNIICSVYNIGKLSKVYQTRYQVIGSHSRAKQEYHISYDPNQGDVEEFTPTRKLSNSVVGIITAAAVLCTLLTVLAICRFVTAARRK
ncbi:hypothetical protein OTU49_004340 [Cherax quadricarinatus]|uniref:Ig-like domain-containing protein n=1 Tax=Cherax quadricarinatus TaxID=27406 RepID=A0AAW0X0V9_CHEQU|nr:uncharacterized protein LOC128695940 [Cherax quadricarinatus]XP_053642880.1 uncharacterized protein LOC128695940 [Cherax quadricarinatus]XP_053642882.1 uncharacterized protein LOC128695940 [Cherax quadricarinatus]